MKQLCVQEWREIIQVLKTSSNSLRGQDTFGTRIYKKETFVWFMYCHLLDITDRPNKVYIFIKLRGSCFQFQQEKII